MNRFVLGLAACGLSAALATSAVAQQNEIIPRPPGAPGGPERPHPPTGGDLPAEQPGGTTGGGDRTPGTTTPPTGGGPGPAATEVKGTPLPIVEGNEQDTALKDKALAELKRRKFDKAVPLFDQLRTKYPDSREYLVYYALCLYETNKLDDAQKIYDKILNEQPENILALLSIARIYSKTAGAEKDATKKAELEERVREKLKSAAANGANCLRAIRTYPEFEKFRTDVNLQIQLIKEPQRVISAPSKDPFRTALTKKTLTPLDTSTPVTTDVPTGPTREEKKALVDRVERLLAEIDEMVNQSNFDGIARVWLEIEDIILQEKNFGKGDTDILARLTDLKRKYKQKQGVVKSLLLKGFYAQGERMVTDMQSSFDQKNHAKIFEVWEALQNHCKRMKATDEQYGKAADDLEARGREWYQKGKILEEISKFRLDITGIVAGASIAKAIINNRIIAENDMVYDNRGNPITELRVQVIKKKRIRFQYKGLEFEEKIRSQR